MYRRVRLFSAAIALLTLCSSAFGATRIIDSFDSGENWKVLPGSDPVALFVTGRLRLQGAKSLGIKLAPGSVGKAAIFRAYEGDLSGDTRVAVAINAPEKNLSVSLIVDTGKDAERRYVSRAANLIEGWQRVEFPLNEEIFYQEGRPGVRTRPADLAVSRGVGFIVYNPTGVRSEIYFDALGIERGGSLKPAVPQDEKLPPEIVQVGDVVEVGVKLSGDAGSGVPVEGVFTGPDGSELRVRGFDPGESEGLRLLRFRPVQSGEHSYYLLVSSKGGLVTTAVRKFEVKAAEQAAAVSPRIIGTNVAWADNFSPYLRALASNGCNTVRIWLSPWGLNLEAEPGVYSPVVARRIDGIMAEAAQLGIGVILTITTSGEFTAGGWEKNPYNRRNGGPCHFAEEFFSEPTALGLFESKVRYCIIRWGAYSSVKAFELAGDIDKFPAPDDASRIAWLRKAASLVETESLYGTKVTVGLSAMPNDTLTVGLSRVSPVSAVGVHLLAKPEDALSFFVDTVRLSERIGKPVFVEEYGGVWQSSNDSADPDGSALKAGLWIGAAVTGNVPLAWWWDSHIMGRSLFGIFKDLSLFSAPVARPLGTGRVIAEDLGDGASIAGTLWYDGAFLVAYGNDVLTAGSTARPIMGKFTIRGLSPGQYQLDLWDVAAGKPAGGNKVMADRQGVAVTLPVSAITAVRLMRETTAEPALRIDAKSGQSRQVAPVEPKKPEAPVEQKKPEAAPELNKPAPAPEVKIPSISPGLKEPLPAPVLIAPQPAPESKKPTIILQLTPPQPAPEPKKPETPPEQKKPDTPANP